MRFGVVLLRHGAAWRDEMHLGLEPLDEALDTMVQLLGRFLDAMRLPSPSRALQAQGDVSMTCSRGVQRCIFVGMANLYSISRATTGRLMVS